MQDQNPIIVLQKFDNFIAANIIKAKLDAYGIPCFLSEENRARIARRQSFGDETVVCGKHNLGQCDGG
jgi:hypothetical protein